jgi:hypothetical protein
MKKALSSLVYVFVIIMVHASSLFAQETYFVSPKGNDSDGEGTHASPWRTIQHAVDEAKPGDVVLVYGTDDIFSYRETVHIDKDLVLSASAVKQDGISTDKIVIREGAHVVVTGFSRSTVIEGTLGNGTKPAKR